MYGNANFCSGDQFLPMVGSPMPEVPPDLAQSAVKEQELRASIQARVATLQRIQLLLDAATIQMNSYLAAVSVPSAIPPDTGTRKDDVGDANATDANQSTIDR